MQRADIIRLIQVRIDEVAPSGVTPVLDPIDLGRELDLALDEFLRQAPRELLYPVGRAISITGTDGLFALPDDFVRFLRFQADGWKNAVDSLLSVESPEAALVRVSGSRYSANRPRAIMVPIRAEGAAVKWGMEVYPQADSGLLFYVPQRQAEDLPDSLIDPLTVLAASRVFVILRQFQASELLRSRYVEMLRAMDIGVRMEIPFRGQ